MRELSRRRRPQLDPYFALGLLGALAVGGGVAWREIRGRPPAAELTGIPPALLAQLESLGIGQAVGRGPVRVVEYADYECPACAHVHQRVSPRLSAMVARGVVSYTAYDVALPNHRNALPAAIVAQCVAEQAPAAFWAMRDELLRTQPRWASEYPPEPYFLRAAARHGADTAAARACVAASGPVRAYSLHEALRRAGQAGLHYTPVWVIDGRVVPNDRVEQALRAVDDSTRGR